MSIEPMWSKNITFVNGEIALSGIPVSRLAREFGTPTFFIDEADFRARALAWNDALKVAFGDKAGTVFYASKAFSCISGLFKKCLKS